MRASDLQNYISKLEQNIRVANAAIRLQSNPDFNVVINDTYLGSYSKELVSLLSQLNDSDSLECVEKLKAISHTEAYLNNLIEQGQLSEAELEAAKAIPDSELY